MLKDISTYKLKDKESAFYIPILDRDPYYAAKSILKKDLEPCYNLLKEVFNEIATNKKYHDVLYDTLLASKDNYFWFISFFKEIEKTLNKFEKYKFNLNASFYQEVGNAPEVYQPFYMEELKEDDYYHLSYYKTNVKSRNPINNYRIRYILENYDMSDFQDDCFPSWYILKNTTIFEQYNERTNKRVRVDSREDGLFYFIAGASDNWKQIENVPEEMDYVIAALIFR